jgi:hypothetical protein
VTDFNYTIDIPAAGNNPSNDQGPMQVNTNSIANILNIDHVGFNAANGGTHLQTSFANFVSPILLPGPTSSVAYPAAGIADNTHPQYFYQNQNATFLLSCVKAFGVFNAGAGPTLLNSFNCTLSGSRPTYTIALGTNVVSGNNIVVILYQTSSGSISYTFANPNLVISSGAVTGTINFLVLQA